MNCRSLHLDNPQIVFSNEELLPQSWRACCRPGESFMFNPSIARFADSILMAYRVVLPDRRRRIALCRLDASLRVIKDSLIPLSDHLTDSGDWHADPRFCIYGKRLLLHFNDGMGDLVYGPNRIYMAELDPDDLTPETHLDLWSWKALAGRLRKTGCSLNMKETCLPSTVLNPISYLRAF